MITCTKKMYSGDCMVTEGSDEITHKFKVPENGTYYLWICHGVHPQLSPAFQCEVKPKNSKTTRLEYAAELANGSAKNFRDANYIYNPRFPTQAWSVRPVILPMGEVKLVIMSSKNKTMDCWVDAVLVVGNADFKPDFRRKVEGGVLDLK